MIGVGPGNALVLISADADLGHAARSVLQSNAFDNGLMCAAEHNWSSWHVYASA